MIINPFPGPEPFTADDRARFFGRHEISTRLSESILGSRCITIYGPQDTGKTSLLRAGVLPSLVDSQDVREVHIDTWPIDDDPTMQLAGAMRAHLSAGAKDDDLSPYDAVMDAAKRAARSSSRLMIVCLDQFEQLIHVERPSAPTEAFLVCLEDLLELPLRPVRVILSLREDSLGRFLDMLRGRLRMLEQYFRIVPFTALELTEIVCKIAATGVPPQQWSAADLLPFMMEMRVHEQAPAPQAEVRLRDAQGFCKTLFERRAAGLPESSVNSEAESYIERTVVDFQMLDAALGGSDEPEATT